jgi:hypothetical protein
MWHGRTARGVAGIAVFPAGRTAECLVMRTAVADFFAYYTRELSSLVWCVMSLGADAHRAVFVG